jgi:peptidoglycan/LPS O-acetylase OafA/YrhL
VPGLDTSDLGWWSLLNFACAAALLASIPPVWKEKALRLVPTLSLLGRHSLGVFLCHFFVVYWIWFACSGVSSEDVTDLNRFGIPLFAVAVLVMFGFAADQKHKSSSSRPAHALPALTPAKSAS